MRTLFGSFCLNKSGRAGDARRMSDLWVSWLRKRPFGDPSPCLFQGVSLTRLAPIVQSLSPVHYVTFSIFGSLERRRYTHIRLYAPSVSLSLVSGERRMSLHVRGQSSSIVARSTPRSFAETRTKRHTWPLRFQLCCFFNLTQTIHHACVRYTTRMCARYMYVCASMCAR